MCQLKFIQRQGGQQLHDFPHGIGKIWPHWMFSQEHFFSSARQLRLREKSMHSLLANWCVCFFLWKGSYQGRVFGKNETVGLVCIKDGKNERRVNVLSKKRQFDKSCLELVVTCLSLAHGTNYLKLNRSQTTRKASKTDEFSKKFQAAFDPPLIFGKSHFAI